MPHNTLYLFMLHLFRHIQTFYFFLLGGQQFEFLRVFLAPLMFLSARQNIFLQLKIKVGKSQKYFFLARNQRKAV